MGTSFKLSSRVLTLALVAYTVACTEPGEPAELPGKEDTSADASSSEEATASPTGGAETDAGSTAGSGVDSGTESGEVGGEADGDHSVQRCGYDLDFAPREVCVSDFSGDYCQSAACSPGGPFSPAFDCLDPAQTCCDGGVLHSAVGLCCTMGCGSRPEFCIEDECAKGLLQLGIETADLDGELLDPVPAGQDFVLAGVVTNPCLEDFEFSTPSSCILSGVTVIDPAGEANDYPLLCQDAITDHLLAAGGGSHRQGLMLRGREPGIYTVEMQFELPHPNDDAVRVSFEVR